MITKIIYTDNDTGVMESMHFTIHTSISDLTGYTAKIKLQGIEKTYTDITSKILPFNLTKEETAELSLGTYNACVTITSSDGSEYTLPTNVLFDIRRNLKNE